LSAECAAEASLTLQLLLAGARDTKAHDRARILDVAGVKERGHFGRLDAHVKIQPIE
jgi:hypothetical protein